MIPADTSLPVETMLNAFVVKFGGQLVGDLIPNVSPSKNADYVFRSPQIVAELKCVEREGFTEKDEKKLRELSQSWLRRGLIRGYGTFRIELRKLPLECQREWMQIHQAPWKRKLADANAQIESTKSVLNLPNACGILFLVRNAPSSIPPVEEMSFIQRILQSTKEDRITPVYSHIERIVYFSVKPRAITSDGIGWNFWIPAYRTADEPAVTDFLERFRQGWVRHLGETLGINAFEAPAGEASPQ